jgi:O-antigen/teichoic acid export membrane protein
MAASGMGLNLLLNLLLIPHFHAVGAAVSSVLTQFLASFLQIYIALRIFKFKVNKRLLTQLIVFIPSTFLFAYITSSIIENWIVGLLIFGISSAAFAFAIGLLHIKSMVRIFKYG